MNSATFVKPYLSFRPLQPSPATDPHGQHPVFVCLFDTAQPSLITYTVSAFHLSHSHVATLVCTLPLKISKPHFHHWQPSHPSPHAQTSKAAKDPSCLLFHTSSIPFSRLQTQNPDELSHLCKTIPTFHPHLTPPACPLYRSQLALFSMNTLYASHRHHLSSSPTSQSRPSLPSLTLVLRPPSPLPPLRYPSSLTQSPKAAKDPSYMLSYAYPIPFSRLQTQKPDELSPLK